MSDSKPIKHTDLIEENVFGEATESTKAFEAEIQKLLLGLKQVAAATGKKLPPLTDPKTTDDVKRQQEAYAKLNAVTKGYTAIQKEIAIVEQKAALIKRDNLNIAKQRAILLEAETGSIKALRAELALVTAQWAKVSEAHRENTVTGKLLTTQKTELTEKLKALEIATGDHRREVGNYAKGLQGLQKIAIGLGEAFGLNKEVLEKVIEGHKIFNHTMHGTHEAMHNFVGDAHESADGAHEAGEEVKKLSLGQKLLALVTGESTGALRIFKIALAATGIGLLIAALGLLYSAWAENKRKTEEMAEITKELAKLNIELKESYEHLEEAVYNAGIRQLEVIKKVLEARMAANGQTIKGLNDVADVQKKITEKELEDVKKKIFVNKSIQGMTERQILSTKQAMVEALQDDMAYSILQKHLLELEIKLNKEKEEGIKLSGDKQDIESNQVINEINLTKDLNGIYEKNADKKKKREEKELKDALDRYYFLKKLQEDELIEMQKLRDQEELDKEQKIKDGMQMWRDAKNAEIDSMIDQARIRKEKEEKERQERIARAIDEQEQIINALKESLSRQNALKEKFYQNQASMADSDIQIQSQLAAKGQANMLDFAYKQKAKALDAELQLKKKQQRQEEEFQLANLFLEFEKTYAKDGAGAAAKALQQTLLAKGIATGFTAFFAEEGGVIGESAATYKGQSHKSGKDAWVLAEEGERVLSVKQNSMFEALGGLDFLKNPQSYIGTTIINDYSKLEKKLDSLEQTIRNKKEFNISEDALKRIVFTESQSGYSVNRVQASSKIIPRGKA